MATSANPAAGAPKHAASERPSLRAVLPRRRLPSQGHLQAPPASMRTLLPARAGVVCQASKAAPAQAAPKRRKPSGGAKRKGSKKKSSGIDRQLSLLRRAPLTARRRAVEQLLRIEGQGAYSGLVNGSPGAALEDEDAAERPRGQQTPAAGDHKALDGRDERLVTELVNGVTRWRRRLDHVLSGLCNTRKADDVMMQLLRVGAYELLECGLPSHALSEHVELAKRGINPGAAKFANGTLRSLSRKIASGDLRVGLGDISSLVAGEEALKQADADTLAVLGSHPTWMVERWIAQFGRDSTVELMAWNNTRPFHCIRLSQGQPGSLTPAEAVDRLRSNGVKAEVSELLPEEFVRIRSGLQVLLAGDILPRGSFAVQDESAGLVVAALDPQPGERVLDCCAAPGGKALFIAERMRGEGSVVAMDVNGRRLKALRNSVKDRGLSNVDVVESDLRDFAADASNHGRFDRVLLDAPCTGLGVLSKRADMRWRRSLPDLQASIDLTHELMAAATRLVSPGGVLVYSTCSIDREENHGPVKALLESFNGEQDPAAGGSSNAPLVFEAVPAGKGVPAALCSNGPLETFPHVHGVDGAFAAKLRRRTPAAP